MCYIGIVLEDLTQILITVPKATQGTNLQVCEPFEHDMIPMSRHEDVLSNSKAWVIVSIR